MRNWNLRNEDLLNSDRLNWMLADAGPSMRQWEQVLGAIETYSEAQGAAVVVCREDRVWIIASENLRKLLFSNDGPPARLLRDRQDKSDLADDPDDQFSPIVFRRGPPVLCSIAAQEQFRTCWNSGGFQRSVVINQPPSSFEKRQLLLLWKSDQTPDHSFQKRINELALIIEDALAKIDTVLLLRSESMVETVSPKWGAAAIVCGEFLLVANNAFRNLVGLETGNLDTLAKRRIKFVDALNGLTATPLPSLESVPPDGRIVEFRDGRQLQLDLTPVRGERSAFFGDRKLVTLQLASARNSNLEELLKLRFRLTATEARIVRRLVEGADSRTIEHEQNIRHDTLKTHLRNIFEKTGVHRQAALVGLAASLMTGLRADF